MKRRLSMGFSLTCGVGLFILDIVTGACFGMMLGGALFLFGATLNTLAISFNDWKMPVASPLANTSLHKPIDSNTRLKPLVDVIPVGGGRLASIGDFLLIIGIVLRSFSLLY